jgi:purine-binding chemotaxis protein CheW
MTEEGTSSQQLLAELASAPAKSAETDEAAVAVDAASLVLMRIGGRWFAVDADAVKEVAAKGFVTRVPTAPRHVLGVTVVRGRIVPVVGLEDMVGSIATNENTATLPRLLVLSTGDSEIALVVDEIRGMIEQHTRGIDSRAPSVTRPYLREEFEHQGRLVYLVDVPALMIAAKDGEVAA